MIQARCGIFVRTAFHDAKISMFSRPWLSEEGGSSSANVGFQAIKPIMDFLLLRFF